MSALQLLRDLFRPPSARPAVEAELPARLPEPEEPVCLLGDLHGRADLLTRFLTLRRRHFPRHRLIVLGDAIDRGNGSAETIRLLRAECAEGAVCLRGNHEEMLLEFLDDPNGTGRRWLAHGGLDTLESFGLRGIPADRLARDAARDTFRARLGPETEAWLRALPRLWRSGDLVAVHAGLDPALPPEAQEPDTLVWGHPAFFEGALRTDGLWVAHGHVVVERAHMSGGRLALDTCAYATGMLSYALIDPAAPPPERMTFAVVPL
ncbi:metallophosphoesterase [Amaricoccus sp. W119]|uniref:metallophosphoesterase n=1 Tax=Amaricoccus sp. W119 TaxID=3391833 RepID=UPI0039A653E0